MLSISRMLKSSPPKCRVRILVSRISVGSVGVSNDHPSVLSGITVSVYILSDNIIDTVKVTWVYQIPTTTKLVEAIGLHV